jgi:poly-gamma-glutamate capsule biosynthesis protein CapA/YwtB (metallophosphatase superfamily)
MLFKKTFISIPIYIFFLNLCLAGNRNDTNKLTLLFAGDVMGHDSQILSAYDDSAKQYDYSYCFQYIAPFIQSADMAIANLEVTLAGPPFKGYPEFSSPDELAVALKNAGFDIMITANNHSLDRGKKGLERTLDVLDSLRVIRTGTFKDPLERASKYPLLVEKNNILLAILNYTYGTNGLKVSKPNVVNYIDTALIRLDLERALKVAPDFIIATVHWGLEYQRKESSVQRELAKFMLAHGADAIIGSHPHVVQPITLISTGDSLEVKEKLVVYSLGNYISNQRKRYTDGGIMFRMELVKNHEDTRIAAYDYLPTWVFKPTIRNKTKFAIVPANSFEKGLGHAVLPEDAKAQMKIFFEDTQLLLEGVPVVDYVFEETKKGYVE